MHTPGGAGGGGGEGEVVCVCVSVRIIRYVCVSVCVCVCAYVSNCGFLPPPLGVATHIVLIVLLVLCFNSLCFRATSWLLFSCRKRTRMVSACPAHEGESARVLYVLLCFRNYRYKGHNHSLETTLSSFTFVLSPLSPPQSTSTTETDSQYLPHPACLLTSAIYRQHFVDRAPTQAGRQSDR